MSSQAVASRVSTGWFARKYILATACRFDMCHIHGCQPCFVPTNPMRHHLADNGLADVADFLLPGTVYANFGPQSAIGVDERHGIVRSLHVRSAAANHC